MELSEEMRYRLCYLTLRLALDQKLERDWGKKECGGVLAFLDLFPQSYGHCLVIPKNAPARNILEIDGLTTGDLKFDENGDAIKTYAVIKTIKDGDIVYYSTYNG